MLTKFQKTKESVLISLLNVALPTVDILTDLISITKLYIGTETHVDCDEASELVNYSSDNSYNYELSVELWYEARRKCIRGVGQKPQANVGDIPPVALPDQLPVHLVHLVERR